MANDKQPSFAERCGQMRAVAQDLKAITDFIRREADLMADAEKRFAERRSDKRKAGR
jgi:hypothetical protein